MDLLSSISKQCLDKRCLKERICLYTCLKWYFVLWVLYTVGKIDWLPRLYRRRKHIPLNTKGEMKFDVCFLKPTGFLVPFQVAEKLSFIFQPKFLHPATASSFVCCWETIIDCNQLYTEPSKSPLAVKSAIPKIIMLKHGNPEVRYHMKNLLQNKYYRDGYFNCLKQIIRIFVFWIYVL